MAPKRTGRVRVFIVDDQRAARYQIRMCLRDQRDLEIEEAPSGRAAIERLLTVNPDVVLMDVAMPDMNGIETTTEIKRLLPSVPVIALTLHDNPEYRKAMLSAGAVGYILKEDLSDELVELIRQLSGGYGV